SARIVADAPAIRRRAARLEAPQVEGGCQRTLERHGEQIGHGLTNLAAVRETAFPKRPRTFPSGPSGASGALLACERVALFRAGIIAIAIARSPRPPDP